MLVTRYSFFRLNLRADDVTRLTHVKTEKIYVLVQPSDLPQPFRFLRMETVVSGWMDRHFYIYKNSFLKLYHNLTFFTQKTYIRHIW